MSIGVAIIGSGIFAKEEHLPAVLNAPNLSLKALYSRSLTSAKSLSESAPSGLDLYSEDQDGKTYDKLLERDDIQAVIIALPILNQPEYIKKALQKGKHVLSEKPVAKDVATAEELINWYKSSDLKATWGVAENFRYIDSILYASSEAKKLGKALNFRGKMYSFVKPGSKYYETSWRKTPDYQGGFVLDGGVHFVAALRLLVNPTNSPEHAPSRVAAFSNLLQEHLPPVDTVDAIWKTKSGTTGTFSVSFATSLSGSEYQVGFEKGSVTVLRQKVIIKTSDGKEETKDFPDEGSGVKQEVKAWAESLAKGEPDERQSPQEALKDLAMIEAMLRSGENNGSPVDLKWT